MLNQQNENGNRPFDPSGRPSVLITFSHELVPREQGLEFSANSPSEFGLVVPINTSEQVDAISTALSHIELDIDGTF